MSESERHKVKFKPPPLSMPAGAECEEEDGPCKTPTTPGATTTPRSEDKSGKEKKKIGHRRVDNETGEVTYKKVPTSDLMGSIQLGIGNSIGALASLPTRDLLLQDFEVIERVSFPEEGTNTTPSHQFGDFRFKTYAPIAFRFFRDLFNIKPEDFLSSICLEPMRELSNPGASGSIFYVSRDDQFIIKTVQHKEAEFLQTLLPGYYMNLQQNPRTLLPKFFGLFCYQSLGKNVRLLVMNNLLPSTVKMHQKYDLKGSTYKRRASRHERTKNSPTLKDLDFLEDHAEGIFLESVTYDALMKTISRDCLVLESFKIMDYSGLVGVHNIAMSQRELEGQTQTDEEGGKGDATTSQGASPSEIQLSSKTDPRNRKVQRNKSMFSTWESIQVDVAPLDLGEDYPAGGIPARNSRGEPLLLFLGIIDILQNYRLFKKMEHTFKSILHDGDTISVHRPNFYAMRFQDFMRSKVFKKIPSLDSPAITGPHQRFRNLVHSFLALRHSPSRRRGRERRGTSGSVEEKHSRTPHQADSQPQTSLTARPDLVPPEARKEATRGGSLRGFDHHHSSGSQPKQGLLQRQETIEESPGPKEVKRLFASTSGDRRSSGGEKHTEVVSDSEEEEGSPLKAPVLQTHL